MSGEETHAAHLGQRAGTSAGLPGAYLERMLIVLLDLAAIGGLVIAIVVTALRLRDAPCRLFT
jgi:hypothetical protein